MKPLNPKQPARPTSIAPFGLSLLLSFWATYSAANAADEKQPQITVSYGILWDGKDPVAGLANCLPDEDCELIDDTDIKLTLNIPRAAATGGATLRAHCRTTECSFAQSRYSVSVGSPADFDLYEGIGYGIHQPLVLTMRPHLGLIKLRVASVGP